MLEKIKKTIVEYNLIEYGDRVVVAISGGPDSVCLLHILHSIREEFGLEVYGAHLNHNFRGIEAQLDAQYVSKLCEFLGVMCFIKSIDVSRYAKEKGLSLEEAGRILRYEFFDEVAERVGASKVAVAHNQNDQAETVLMRLLRGTGIQGLGAIRHKRSNIIRPLLDSSRREIEEYCTVHQLEPRIDQTNLEPIYHRNKIRLELVPYLQENYNPNIIESLVKTADMLKVDSDFIESQARDVYDVLKVKEKDACLSFSIEGMNRLHCALRSRLFRLAVEELIGKKETLEYKHVQSLMEMAEKGVTGKRIVLPMGIEARISYEKLLIYIRGEEEMEFDYLLPLEGTICIEEIKGTFTTKLFKKEEIKEISRDKYLKFFDYGKIKDTLNVRNRRDGDRFFPLGLSGSKKLKDFFIDCKIDREKRAEIPLLCDGDQIMWVVGYRISENYKITEDTSEVLSIQYEKENE